MKQPRQRRTMHSFAGLAAALLWGAVELVALARSRWSARLRQEWINAAVRSK